MANSLRVPEDVATALKALRDFANDDTLQLVGQWYNNPLPSPAFGPLDAIDSLGDTFDEAVQISQRYATYGGATRQQVNSLYLAVTELCTLAGQILDAYTEAESNQVKGLNDLANAMNTELAKINTDLGGSTQGQTP
jgi:hypothetical protein